MIRVGKFGRGGIEQGGSAEYLQRSQQLQVKGTEIPL